MAAVESSPGFGAAGSGVVEVSVGLPWGTVAGSCPVGCAAGVPWDGSPVGPVEGAVEVAGAAGVGVLVVSPSWGDSGGLLLAGRMWTCERGPYAWGPLRAVLVVLLLVRRGGRASAGVAAYPRGP